MGNDQSLSGCCEPIFEPATTQTCMREAAANVKSKAGWDKKEIKAWQTGGLSGSFGRTDIGSGQQFPTEPVDQHGSSSHLDEGAPMGGLGMMFLEDSEGLLHTHMIRAEGPAHQCGLICKGDKLVQIDGQKTLGLNSASQASPNISGPHGTSVRLLFERENASTYEVVLTRDSSFYPDQVAIPPPG
jgi:hypothetical protein